MDAGEFEFPPDLLDDDVGSRPPVSPPPSSTAPPYPYVAQNLPLSVLAQTPVDQLPPTRPNNPQNFSIGQKMRGALSTAHARPMSGVGSGGGAGGGGAFSRAMASVLPLPDVSAYTRHSTTPLTRSPHLSAGHPPQQQQQQHGASTEHAAHGSAEDGFDMDSNNNSGHDANSSSSGATTVADVSVPHLAPAGRHNRMDWSEGEVRSFYQALSQFGTDFSAISVLFPRRTRGDIKRLYSRELRLKPKEVQHALHQKNPIDMKLFQERYEAKQKEEQVPVTTKELNVEELALVDEIENGLLGGATTSAGPHVEGEAVAVPAALEAGEEATAAPTSTKSRKRKREAGVEKSPERHASPAPTGTAEEETLYEMAMRYDRENNTPLESLYADQPVSFEDSEFSFE